MKIQSNDEILHAVLTQMNISHTSYAKHGYRPTIKTMLIPAALMIDGVYLVEYTE